MKINQIRAASVGRGDTFFRDRITLNGSALIASATAFTLQIENKHPIKDEGFLFATVEDKGEFTIWFFMVKDSSITEVESNEKYNTIAEVEKTIHSVESSEARNKPNRLIYTTAHGLQIIDKELYGVHLASR